MDIRTRIQNSKQYVKDHAPAVVTATATVVTALAVIGLRQDLNKAGKQVRRALSGDTSVVEQCIAEGRGYTYLPGLGVHVHPSKDNLITEKN